MSKVTQVTVRYRRSIQPKSFESKEGMLEAVVMADEGEQVTQEELAAIFEDLIANVHDALRGGVANSTDEPAKKTRKTRAKKGAKADAVADEVPVDGDEVTDTGVEVVSVDEAVAADTVNEVSDQELQSAAAGAAAKHGAAKVKELMKEFDVTLLGRLGQKAREMFMVKLEELGS